MSNRVTNSYVKFCRWSLRAIPGLATILILGVAALLLAGGAAADGEKPWPTFDRVKYIVEQHFASLKDRKPEDIISQGDVQGIFDTLKENGWNVAERKDILANILPDNHFLVQQLRSTAGKAFMRKTSSYGLIYDRLDRISDHYGGKQLISELILLPNGDQFAKQKNAQGDPSLLDLLPREVGLSPKIKNYDKRTGKIYTTAKFVERLRDIHSQIAQEKATTTAKEIRVVPW